MTSVPKDFKDYDDTDPEIDFRKNRMDYWASLKLLRKEYMETLKAVAGQFDAWDFEEYVEKNYGLRMNIVNGNITDTFTITDEKLYLVFILKFK